VLLLGDLVTRRELIQTTKEAAYRTTTEDTPTLLFSAGCILGIDQHDKNAQGLRFITLQWWVRYLSTDDGGIINLGIIEDLFSTKRVAATSE
jgi:hypothetical protein